MRKSKFTEEQITYAPRQVESWTPPADVCRQLGVSELRKLRSLEDENARLKRLVADLSLDKHILTEPCEKKSEAHTAPRAGRLGADHLRRQLRAGLSLGAVQSGRLVPAIDPRRPGGVAVAHSGVGLRASALRVHADLGPAATRRMAGE